MENTDQIEVLESQIEVLNNEIEELKLKIEGLEKDNESLEESNDRLHEELKESEFENEVLRRCPTTTDILDWFHSPHVFQYDKEFVLKKCKQYEK